MDSDDDGPPDTWELSWLGNLAASGIDDDDSDGASNGIEYAAGTSPADPDSDDDLMDDGWEIAYGLNPGDAGDAGVDSDGDCFANLQEYQRGRTNPLDSAYHPADCDCNCIWDGLEADADNDGVIDTCDTCPGTIRGTTVDEAGCPPLIPGDFDHDGDVGPSDSDAFENCASGPAIPYAGACSEVDADGDNDVDQSDFGILQRCLSGEDVPADPNCAN